MLLLLTEYKLLAGLKAGKYHEDMGWQNRFLLVRNGPPVLHFELEMKSPQVNNGQHHNLQLVLG